jgi:hypothetical protein
VATGPTLADRQVLAPGPRSTQYLSFAADARGDAVVAFWRYEGTQFAVWASYRPAGGRFSAAQRLATGDLDNPHVAIEDDGSASVVFGDEHGVRVVDHAPAATAFTAPQALPGAGRPISDAAVARSGGRTTIAWVGTATGGAPSVLVSDRLGAGAAFSAPVGLSAASVRLRRDPPPAVAFDGDRALVSWVEGTAGTSTHDQAALATSTAPGRWEPVQTRGVTAPTHVAVTRLTSGAHGRRALLVMTTQRGGQYRTLTASVRADGTLGPTRAPAALARSSTYFAYAAQGVRHTYVLADHPLGRGGVFQPALVSSAP